MARATPPPPPPSIRQREATTSEHEPGAPGIETRARPDAPPSAGGPGAWSLAAALVVGAVVGAVLAGTLFSGDAEPRPPADVDELQESNARLRSQVADAAARNGALEGEIAALRDRVSQLRADIRRIRWQHAPIDVNVDYGRWAGLFDISQLVLRRTPERWLLGGEIEYLGGGACPLGYLEVGASVWRDGEIVATGANEFDSLTRGRPEALSFRGPRGAKPDRADVALTTAHCAA